MFSHARIHEDGIVDGGRLSKEVYPVNENMGAFLLYRQTRKIEVRINETALETGNLNRTLDSEVSVLSKKALDELSSIHEVKTRAPTMVPGTTSTVIPSQVVKETVVRES